jgi:hypothetical protein
MDMATTETRSEAAPAQTPPTAPQQIEVEPASPVAPVKVKTATPGMTVWIAR